MSREADEEALVAALAPMTYNGVVDDVLGDVIQAVLGAGFHRDPASSQESDDVKRPALPTRLLNRGVTARLRCDAAYGDRREFVGQAPPVEATRASLVAALRLLAEHLEEGCYSISDYDLRVLAEDVEKS
jgi:hypothetical protein